MRTRKFAREVGFQLEVIWQDQDLLEVRIIAWNGSFGGVTPLYVGNGELEEIARVFSGFPKNPSDVREIMLGTFGREFAGTIEGYGLNE